MIRLFVGLALPEDVVDRLAELEVGIPGTRWIEADNLHLTLRFIGEVEDGLAREIHDELAHTIRAPALELAVDGLGTFGSRQVRALYAGVPRTPELARLQAKIEAAIVRLGMAPEPRKFTPHITLARLKGAPTGRIQDFISGQSPFTIGPFRIDHVTLFRSHLGRTGADYDPVAEYPLGG